MKKGIFSIAATLLGFGLTAATSCGKQSFEQQLEADVRNFNEHEAPQRQEPILMLDSMAFDANIHTLSHFYTVEGDGERLFPADLWKEEVRKNVRSSLALKPHKEHGINLRYVYYGKSSGKVLMDATYTPEDYR